MITTQINIEETDTFGGEANYCWVNRKSYDFKEGQDVSDLMAVKKAKKLMGWNGVRCKTENYGDEIVLRPYGINRVLFINFHCFGNAS